MELDGASEKRPRPSDPNQDLEPPKKTPRRDMAELRASFVNSRSNSPLEGLDDPGWAPTQLEEESTKDRQVKPTKAKAKAIRRSVSPSDDGDGDYEDEPHDRPRVPAQGQSGSAQDLASQADNFNAEPEQQTARRTGRHRKPPVKHIAGQSGEFSKPPAKTRKPRKQT